MSYSWKAPRSGSIVGGRSSQLSFALTLELLIQTSSARHAKRTDELLEVYVAILILIEDVEDVIREFAWVAEGEELLVYFPKFCFVELA